MSPQDFVNSFFTFILQRIITTDEIHVVKWNNAKDDYHVTRASEWEHLSSLKLGKLTLFTTTKVN